MRLVLYSLLPYFVYVFWPSAYEHKPLDELEPPRWSNEVFLWASQCLPSPYLKFFSGPEPRVWPEFFAVVAFIYLGLLLLSAQTSALGGPRWLRGVSVAYALFFHLLAAGLAPREANFFGGGGEVLERIGGRKLAQLPWGVLLPPSCFFGAPVLWWIIALANLSQHLAEGFWRGKFLLLPALVGLLSLGRLVLRDGGVAGGWERQGGVRQWKGKKGMWGMFLAWVFLVPVVVGGSWAYARAMRVLGKVVLRTVQLCPVLETDAGCSAGFVVFAVLVFLGGWLGVWMWVGRPSVGALGVFLLACWGMIVGLFGFFGWPWLDLGLFGFFLGEYPWPLAKNQPLWLALAGLCWLGASWLLARSARRAESR